MTRPILPPSPNPCGSCPYRQDVPSGVWAREEYAKLIEYDAETALQPAAIFMCHQRDGRVCAGWCGTHDMSHNLAVRFAAIGDTPEATINAILDYSTDVPLFSSGQEAAAHGLRDIEFPKSNAVSMGNSLLRKRRFREGR